MRVIGVDASSTRLAAVTLTDDWVRHERLKLPGEIEDACLAAYRWARDLTHFKDDIGDIDLVLVEAPFFHRQNPNGSVGLAQVNGALLAGFADVRVLSVQVSKWKKAVVGKGNATKDEVADFVMTNFPKIGQTFVHHRGTTDRSAKVLDQDLCDALCVALHAQEVARLRHRHQGAQVKIVRRTRGRARAAAPA